MQNCLNFSRVVSVNPGDAKTWPLSGSARLLTSTHVRAPNHHPIGDKRVFKSYYAAKILGEQCVDGMRNA